MDGVDAALVSFGDHSIDVIATHQHDYPGALRHALVAARSLPDLRHSDQVRDLHRLVGECFRDAALALIANASETFSASVPPPTSRKLAGSPP